MADENQEAEELLKELGLYEDEGEDAQEEVERRYEQQDAKVLKAVKRQSEMLTKHLEEEQAERVYQKFIAEATDTEKEIASVFLDENMSPSQMERAISTIKLKAKNIDEKLSPQNEDEGQDEERVKEEAKKLAAAQWGSGPIDTSRSLPDKDPEVERMARIASGDINALVEAMFRPPPRPE